MPKNSHPPRSGGSRKPSANDEGKKTKGKNAAGPFDDLLNPIEGGANAQKKQQGAVTTAEDGPKKPTTRELLAGTSWTGKLPLNLFNEHCQKAQWEKPEFTMHRLPSGFVSSVILRKKNPKTQEITQLPPTRFPKSHEHLQARETAVEARHFAAAWALYRVANMKNIHMTLPPQFKDLWKGPFTEIKTEDFKQGKASLYSADPFQAYKDHEEEQAKMVKRKEEAEKERAKREEAKASGDLFAASGSKDVLRGWKTAPRVEMGRRLRRDVEALVRLEGAWNVNEKQLTTHDQNRAVDQLSGLGFRASHCREAVSFCGDYEEALEWLLVHLPEDDLPRWALPENYVAGVSMAGDLQREAAIKRLAAAGYSRELCEDMFDMNKQDEVKAARELQAQLFGERSVDGNIPGVAELSIGPASGNANQAWNDEKAALESIYADRFTAADSTSCSVKVETSIISQGLIARFIINPAQYPNAVPILQVLGSIPSYIKLSMTQQALHAAFEQYLGQPMIFSIVEWLEQHAHSVYENPGKLADIAAASALVIRDATPSTRDVRLKRARHPESLDESTASALSQSLITAWRKKQQSPAQQKMLQARRRLPAWAKQESIVSAIKTHQVTIISGATGSGKSTQAVQFVLDDMIQRQLGGATKIVCTQPRRISALGLADRVAEERCGIVGDEVGYAIRGESKHSPNTRITFCTTGVLLRRLQTSGGSRHDLVKSLADISHVIVDEVHERNLDTDFLLALLKDVISLRKDIKVILMSATLDAAAFMAYFGGPKKVASVEVEGRTFPVDDYYLDDIVGMIGYRGDQALQAEMSREESSLSISKAVQSIGMGINYDLIAALVRYIDSELGSQDGGILIFLPGTMEIKKALDGLGTIPNIHALPLHAGLLPSEQRRVFPAAPKGKRKVIAATNVAETSITIPDIVAVIDSGRVKETQYDPQSGIARLVEVWASKAASQQRRGRAGRVSAGKAYKLFTRQAEETKMPDKPQPEIQRTPLEQLCLSVKAMGVNDASLFLAETITPPESVAVESALDLLRRMGAMTDESLTALGQHMAMIPADLRCAKLMVLGALFGCLEAAVTIAAILTVKSPFVSPQDKRNEAKAAREAFGNGASIGDLMVDLRAFDVWSSKTAERVPFREIRAWCDRNFLSNQTLNDIASTRQQYSSSLQETGVLRGKGIKAQAAFNVNAASLQLLNALVLAALSPQTLRILYPPTKFTATSSGNLPLDPTAKSIHFFDESKNRVFIHPSSTLFSAQGYPGSPGFMSYWSKVATSKVFARELCPAGTFAALLFAGSGIEVDKLGRGVIVDGWMRIRGWPRIGVLVGRLRSVIDAKLREWYESPAGSDMSSLTNMVGLVRRLVELDGLDQ